MAAHSPVERTDPTWNPITRCAARSPRQRRHTAQHDDHCLVTFGGINWRIVGMRGLAAIDLVSLDGTVRSSLSLADTDLTACCDMTVARLAPDMAIDNAKVRHAR
ncbi:hypothetical protein [Methylobacterium sp. JK268]